MAYGISNRLVADYVASQILSGNATKVIPQLAAYLIQAKRKKDYSLLVDEIERKIADKGIVLVRILSARPLSSQSMKNIESFMMKKTGAKQVELLTQLDESVVGGAVISTADFKLDASLRNRLNKLKNMSKK